MEINKRADNVIYRNWKSKSREYSLKYFDILKKIYVKSSKFSTGTEAKEIILKSYLKKMSSFLKIRLNTLYGYIIAVLKSVLKTMKQLISRIFLRYKWINRSHFMLASLVNVLLNSSQIPDPIKKIEKFKQKVEYTGEILRNYKHALYKKYKSIDLKSKNIDQLIQNFLKITILVQEELIKINKKYNRKQKIRRYLFGILDEINPFTK